MATGDVGGAAGAKHGTGGLGTEAARRRARRPLAAGLGLTLALAAPPARADEGMWTFTHFPAASVGEKYGFAPDEAWLARVRLGSIRLAGGCSASLVSPAGLVMTNHHC